jgi:hypothetical protein
MPSTPGPSLPGFPSFTFPNINIPGLPIPAGFPEDILALINAISLLLPGGKYTPNLNPDLDKKLIAPILKLLDVLTPFLSMYKFILPILNMILCILEVLCALISPFKIGPAISKLFTQCIPDFLALFPIFAIILMIISLIKLIIALVKYIIQEILRIILQLLKNVFLLQKIIARQDTRSALTALRKIGSLLCYFSNLFAVLQVIALLLQVIVDILKLSFPIPPCSDQAGVNSQCCTPDVCPAFIKNGGPPAGATTGTLQYLNDAGLEVSASTIALFPPGFASIFAQQSAVRQESWQFYDATLTGTNAFYNITTAIDAPAGFTFFPAGQTYDAGTNPGKAPYTINLRMLYNPTQFTYTPLPLVPPDSDGYTGARFIQINNCIVTKTPPTQATGWNGQPVGPTNGVLYLTGGQAFEDDGITKITIAGNQATLNSLIHNPIEIVDANAPDNPVVFSNVTYTFSVNYPILVAETLITVGCMPDVALTKNTINSIYGPKVTAAQITELTNALPNITGTGAGAAGNTTSPPPNGVPNPGAVACLNNALTTMRTNINPASIAVFQASTNVCLNRVLADCSNVINLAVDAGVSATSSVFVESTIVQFTTLPIVVTVTLNDANGSNLCDGIPTDVATLIAAKLAPEITFGVIGPFTYDGSAFFNANITSTDSGGGTLQVAYNNDFISTVSIVGTAVSVANTELTYQFVNTSTVTNVGEPRRNEGDVARDVTGE